MAERLDPLTRYDVDEIEQVMRSQTERALESCKAMRSRGRNDDADVFQRQIAAVQEKHDEIIKKLRAILKK